MNTFTSLVRASLVVLFFQLACSAQAASGPSVNQLSNSLSSTWSTLLEVTNCNLKSPQDSLCIQTHHGETITIKLFGEPVNALILFETFTTSDITGPVITQQSGFLIGPINSYGYKVIHEKISHGSEHKRQIIDAGLRVFAHSTSGDDIGSQGVELNKVERWLDGRHEPWVYHWSALNELREALKALEKDLNKQGR